MTRRGFTLVEILVAIVLAGVVALLVWGVAGAAADSRERVLRAQQDVRAHVVLRALLTDALIHTTTPASGTGFSITHAVDPLGRSRDRLTFVTAGGLPPLTADVEWVATLEVLEGDLLLQATPRWLAPPATVAVRLPGVDGLSVAALNDAGTWTAEWMGPDLPRAVAITPWAGSRPITPVLVTIPATGRGIR